MTVLMICLAAIFALASFLDRNSPPQFAMAHVPAAHPFPKWFLPVLSLWLVVTVARNRTLVPRPGKTAGKPLADATPGWKPARGDSGRRDR